MKRDDAREYFQQSGITYQDITPEDIERLSKFLAEEFKWFRNNGDKKARLMGMNVAKTRKKDSKFLSGKGLQYANLHVSGSYFERREAITFNQNGFIGFGGELSDVNVQPILKAFCRWCDTVVLSEGNVHKQEVLERKLQATAQELERVKAELAQWKKAYRKLDPIGYRFKTPLKQEESNTVLETH